MKAKKQSGGKVGKAISTKSQGYTSSAGRVAGDAMLKANRNSLVKGKKDYSPERTIKAFKLQNATAKKKGGTVSSTKKKASKR